MNVGDSGGGHNGRSQDFDINLAPIIDCFTVLITFMLVSASFLAVGILDTNLAVSGPAPADAKPPSIRMDVELGLGKEIQFRISGKAKIEKRIPAKAGEWDLAALGAEIQSIKKQWPDTNSLILTAHDDMEYVHIVKVMEAMRAHVPSILLGGL
jgi:biopolymer transport protein TolR